MGIEGEGMPKGKVVEICISLLYVYIYIWVELLYYAAPTLYQEDI